MKILNYCCKLRIYDTFDMPMAAMFIQSDIKRASPSQLAQDRNTDINEESQTGHVFQRVAFDYR